jgi:hypothetical protein
MMHGGLFGYTSTTIVTQARATNYTGVHWGNIATSSSGVYDAGPWDWPKPNKAARWFDAFRTVADPALPAGLCTIALSPRRAQERRDVLQRRRWKWRRFVQSLRAV